MTQIIAQPLFQFLIASRHLSLETCSSSTYSAGLEEPSKSVKTLRIKGMKSMPPWLHKLARSML